MCFLISASGPAEFRGNGYPVPEILARTMLCSAVILLTLGSQANTGLAGGMA
jgi:hypothetical protein